MPYRRLPNTDQARLKALQKAVQRASEEEYSSQVLQYSTLTEAQRFVLQFENQVSQYQNNFNSRVSASRQYRKMVQNAKMYISHFIQVLNLAVVRGEIKKEQKKLYHLDPDLHVLPDLVTEEDLLVWGKNIIEGEQSRIAQGGFPIYNPTINKVRVHYDIFKENKVNQNMHKKTETRTWESLENLRREADRIILDIWNQVEEHYKGLLPYAKMRACQNYGVIYYYRKDESRLTEDTDRHLQQAAAAQLSLL
ncbi:MAG: hypothetical protein J6T32_00045 [Paludibacteraceae bacterium]|nr:hypothetical protein [Paludibacteraceae bacterium]